MKSDFRLLSPMLSPMSAHLKQWLLISVFCMAGLFASTDANAAPNPSIPGSNPIGIGFAYFKADGIYMYSPLAQLPADTPISIWISQTPNEAMRVVRFLPQNTLPVATSSDFLLTTGEIQNAVYTPSTRPQPVYEYLLTSYQELAGSDQQIWPHPEYFVPNIAIFSPAPVTPAKTPEQPHARTFNIDGYADTQVYSCVGTHGAYLVLGRPGHIQQAIYHAAGIELDEEAVTCEPEWVNENSIWHTQ